MDSPLGLAKFLFPQVPSLANTAVWHSLGMTETSSKWDLRTTLTVQVLRTMMSGGGKKPTTTIGKVQAGTLKDPGIKGKIWVAKSTIKAPKPDEEGVRNAIFKAIDDMKEGEVNYTKPDLVDTEVEWTGYRPNAGKEEALPDVSEEEKYKRLLAEPSRTSETTILLAKETHGRVCSVRYRLAPQAAFPSQLLDAFMMYLSLLYPPPGSLHEAIPAKNILIAGDSAGGNLAFALLQLLLQLHRTSDQPKVQFHEKDVDVPLPAGTCANSGWFDISRAMPSITNNAKYDYLPSANHDDSVSRFPKDNVWPTNPPRGDLFCDLSLLDHPLASPLASESWEKSPPLWMCTGTELLTDEDKVVAARAASQGVKVQYEEYEAMPHCFAMLIPSLATAERCMKSWGDFARRCVEEPESVKTNGTFIEAKSGKESEVDVSKVTELSVAQARQYMKEAKDRRLQGYEKEGKTMPKPAL
ncbi:hypothetical protein LTR78_007116 [Recurvomyces mirabilis]|uniref:Alpha/beta hydrolase fold-3 domain-containing protein n=1 Tax=Recurvomyces mirabilis TaxID=574656 RepID=A0AAE1BYV0_9PEZI|nr:hypothetical protein LTR78_007116 [Recurvomyces mirabilis]KAK5150912.1 hypothetical protein LTS14_009715 [Recurvomyces mirabilis]